MNTIEVKEKIAAVAAIENEEQEEIDFDFNNSVCCYLVATKNESGIFLESSLKSYLNSNVGDEVTVTPFADFYTAADELVAQNPEFSKLGDEKLMVNHLYQTPDRGTYVVLITCDFIMISDDPEIYMNELDALADMDDEYIFEPLLDFENAQLYAMSYFEDAYGMEIEEIPFILGINTKNDLNDLEVVLHS